MAESLTKSRSESVEEISHHSLLERHRSPSATEIYTNARSYLVDNKEQLVHIIDNTDEVENQEDGNTATADSNNGSPTHSNRAKEKFLKKPTRYRSQSTGAVDSSRGTTAVTTTKTTKSSTAATPVGVATKKPTLDRARTDNMSNFKEFDKKSPSTFDRNNTKRHLEKPPKKGGSTCASSPEAVKQIVPPLSSTPELIRSNNKNNKLKSSSSASKKLMSRSYADGAGGAGGGASQILSSSAASALLSTPPRHVGSLRDDLTNHTPSSSSSSSFVPDSNSSNSSSASTSNHTHTLTTPVKDTNTHTSNNKIPTKPSGFGGLPGKLKAVSSGGGGVSTHSRNSSPAPFDPPSGRSSRSNSGSSNAQLGIISPLTVGGSGGNHETNENLKSSGAPLNNGGGAGGGAIGTSASSSSSGVSNNASTTPSSGVSGAHGNGTGGGGGSSNPFGGSRNPFASTAASSSTAAGLQGTKQPTGNKTFFEQRLQEAQALNRKELVEGAVMHEFSLWKNFSKANADNSVPSTGADIFKAGGKEGAGEVAPPKKPSRVRAPIDRASDEAIEQSDREGGAAEPNRSRSSSNSNSSTNASTSRRGVKIKPLSPVAATNSHVKPKSSRKLSNSAKKNKNRIAPLASFSCDEADDALTSNIDDVAPAISKSGGGGKNRVSMKPLVTSEDTDRLGGTFELEDENGEMQEYEVQLPTTPPLSPSLSQSPPPQLLQQHTPIPRRSGEVAQGGHSRGLARNFRSMVGSCKKSVSSAASDMEVHDSMDMDSILSEHSEEITDSFAMHRSVSGSIASMESSVQSIYDDREEYEEEEEKEEDLELAIFGVAHDEDGDVDLSFISEDDNCVLFPSYENDNSLAGAQGGLDVDQGTAVQRTLILSKREEEDDLLEEEEELLSAKEMDEDVDSLLLSQSQGQSNSHELSAGSLNHVPFSPRALDEVEEENLTALHPPPIAKIKVNRDSTFSFDNLEETSLDQSAEIVNTSASFENLLFAEPIAPQPLPLLQPLQVCDGSLSSATNRVPSLTAHLALKNRNAHLFGDTYKLSEDISCAGGGSAPSSSRLPTERTTERHAKNNSKYQNDNNFNVNTNTCVMSATLGNPPPLLKANLQAKQTIKRNNYQDKGSKESKSAGGGTKPLGGKKKEKSKSSSKRDREKSCQSDSMVGTQQDLSPLRQPSPGLITSNTNKTAGTNTSATAQSASVLITSEHDLQTRNERSLPHDVDNDDCSISSELSEMSNASHDDETDFDPENPFPMTEAEKAELQMQQHRQYLQMGGGGLGRLAKQGASTAPAALGSPNRDDREETASSIDVAQQQSQGKHSHQQHSEEQDRMFRLENGFQWKKGNDVLGHGSFGQVYKGMNYDTGELLAVKQICLNDGTEDEVMLLRKEIDVMKDLDHPNIVRYVGTSISSRHLFIVLEYVPGGSVAGTLSQFGAFSEPLIRRFVSQIITGVDYLHQKQIIHRDIKGANVLVTDAGIAKLADFGCSKQLGGMVTASLEESMRIIRGSVPWMAPEVIKQVGHGRSADLWSVGATMIEMATAKHPWPEFSNNLAALFHVATSKDPPPIPGHLSAACAQFMARCLVIDPKDRATAKELMHDPFLQAPSAVAVASSSGSGASARYKDTEEVVS